MRERLRKLHFEGREFTWTADIRAAPGADGRKHRYIRVRIWGAGKNGCALQADLTESPVPAAKKERVTAATEKRVTAATEEAVTAAKEERVPVATETTYAYPSAAIVCQLIAWGQAERWIPEKAGGTFRVSPVTGPVLPGLALVEVP